MHMRRMWKTGMVFCFGGKVELARTSLKVRRTCWDKPATVVYEEGGDV